MGNSIGLKLVLGTCVMLASCLLAQGLAASSVPPDHIDAAAQGVPRLFFPNGGRTVSVMTDGSDRQVLTRNDARPSLNGLGDFDPKVSPSGKLVVFTRWSIGPYGLRSDLLEADAETGLVIRRLARSDVGGITGANWVPDQDSVLVSEVDFGSGRLAYNNVYKVGLSTGVRTEIFREAVSFDKPRYVSSPGISPDGSKVIFTLLDTTDLDLSSVFVRDLAGKQLAQIENSSGGVWSPDGDQIATSSSDLESKAICSVSGICRQPSELVVTSADGEDARTLTHFGSNLTDPSWSSDGSQIAFQSDRNVPGEFAANEIYKMNADGSCLDWLTNGSPESVEPSWGPGNIQAVERNGCGTTARKPLVEIEPRRDIAAPGKQMLWAGKQLGNHLLSDIYQSRWTLDVLYSDCPNFSAGRCDEPVAIAGASSCSAIQNENTHLQVGRLDAFRRVRGGGRLILTHGAHRLRSGLVVTGGIGAFVGASDIGSRPGDNSIALQLKLARALRPLGSSSARQPLPRVLLKPIYRKQLTEVARMKRKGLSNRAISKRTGLSKSEVRTNIFESRALAPISDIGTQRCGNHPKAVRRAIFGSGQMSSSGQASESLVAIHTQLTGG